MAQDLSVSTIIIYGGSQGGGYGNEKRRDEGTKGSNK